MLQTRKPYSRARFDQAHHHMTAGQKIPRCFKCESRGHWTKDCTTPRPETP